MSSTIVKKFGQLRQWTGEKLGGTQRTDTSEEFKRLDQETLGRIDSVARLQGIIQKIIKHLSRKKDHLADKVPRTPMEAMSVTMIAYGTSLDTESVYGKSLIKAGAAHDKLALEQLNFAQNIKETYMCKLDGILEESKEYDQLKKKLENRRLDFDAKLNQVQKAKKETPQLEEATRVAQAKYEETMTALTNKMIEINSTEEDQLQGLLGMLEFELKYHESCVAILKTVCADLSGIPRHVVPPRQVDFTRSRSTSFEELNSSNPDRKLGYAAKTGNHVLPTSDSVPMAVPVVLPIKKPALAGRKLVKVTFDFDAEGSGELTIRKGDILEVTAEIDPGWWEGFVVGVPHKRGMFPSNYTQPHSEEVSAPAFNRPSFADQKNSFSPPTRRN